MSLRPVKETLKNMALLFLIVSTVFLAYRTWIYDESLVPPRLLLGLADTLDLYRIPYTLRGSRVIRPSAAARYSEALRPARAAVTFPDGRYGVEYDSAAVDQLYLRVAPHLGEVIASADEPEPVGEAQWREALAAPGVYLDFLGSAPLSAVARWQGADAPAHMRASVRRIALSFEADSTLSLYYADGADGRYYRCASATGSGALAELLEPFSPNGYRFAFETGDMPAALPDTLVAPSAPSLSPISMTVPEADTQLLRALLEAFGMNPHGTYGGYTQGDGTRVVVENDRSLLLSPDGTVRYTDLSAGAEPGLTADTAGSIPAVDAAVQAAAAPLFEALSTRVGDAELYLISAGEAADGTLAVTFGYRVEGAHVASGRTGSAAQFVFRGGRAVSAELTLRSCSVAGPAAKSMPVRQAAAIAASGGARDFIPALCYFESGGIAAAAWSV